MGQIKQEISAFSRLPMSTKGLIQTFVNTRTLVGQELDKPGHFQGLCPASKCNRKEKAIHKSMQALTIPSEMAPY